MTGEVEKVEKVEEKGKKNRTLEGVVVLMSEVNKVKKDGKLYVLHCDCLRPNLWGMEHGICGRVNKQCPKCGMFPWIVGEPVWDHPVATT